ncbi:MAG TPA: AAA family ATPase, partial [Clostridia bacterium]|nr:AAA family ATPase [Clostridia bacterium]
QIQKKRSQENLITEPMSFHMIFKGNPGTGKTTVARIMGRLFKKLGVLQKGHLIEVERGDIVGEYIGQTAQKTKVQLKRAMGGILFIDEAYSLARGGEKDFGKEAIDTLVKSMEDFREQFVLILAGYHDEMDRFLLTNPGLRSRFPIKISFPNYSTNELLAIANLMLKERQYNLSINAREELRMILERESREFRNSGNARLVRNIIERAIRRQAVRLLKEKEFSRNDLIKITKEDLIHYC